MNDADVRLLRRAADKLIEHGETGLGWRVDALADELNGDLDDDHGKATA